MEESNVNDNTGPQIIDKLNIRLDVILKSLSLAFLVTVGIGAALVVSYFRTIDMGNEIVGMLASPTVLSTVAIYALAISVIIIALHLAVPIIFNFVVESEFSWADSETSPTFRWFLLSVWLPLLLVTLLAAIDMMDLWNVLIFVLPIVYAIDIYRLKGGFVSSDTLKELGALVNLVLACFFVIFLLVLVALPLINASSALQTPDWLTYVAFGLLSFVYAVCVSYSMTSNERYRLLPLIIFGAVVCVLMFTGPMKLGLIKNMGIGIYQTNLSVENKHLFRLPVEIKKEETEEGYDVSILNDVWVAASLSDKLVLATSQKLDKTYTIPAKAVLSEW